MKARSCGPQDGFTLLEILVAVSIFALSVLAFVQSRSISLRNVVESEHLAKALQAGQMKMTEMEMKYQKLIDKDGVASSYGKENGTFEAPFQDYKWAVELKEAEMKMTQETFTKVLMSLGYEKEDAESQAEDPSLGLLLTNLNSTLKDNYAELVLEVSWDQFGRKAKLPLVTHLIPEKPKIQLKTTVENEK